ncbi:hypothetical protein B0H14DRAFT_3865909 [Mycena olivaceomarginata]|nr:hypothetical protein B0H14DRAFT_3865909 [Mycena olivaceomarginata]
MGPESLSDPEESRRETTWASTTNMSRARRLKRISRRVLHLLPHARALELLKLQFHDEQRRAQRGGRHRGGPVAPITPLPGARFDLGGGPPPAVPAGKDTFAPAVFPDEDDFSSSIGKTKSKSSTKKLVPVSSGLPLPVWAEDGPAPASPLQLEREREKERQRNVALRSAASGAPGQQMYTARAHDGRRTQSGGLRWVLMEN